MTTDDASTNRLSRRRLLGAAAVGAGALGGLPGLSLAHGRSAAAGTTDPSAIEHIVVLMLENRSFDHFLGWLPGADGRQAGLQYADSGGTFYSTYPLAPDWQGCGKQDPDHSYDGARVEYDHGRCDGWLLVNDTYSIGYYTQTDLPFLGRAAPGWTTFDRYFAAFLGPTFPNRIYQHAGVTDRISNTTTISTLPTIWDSLAAAGVSNAYYYSDVPFLALWGTKYLGIARPYTQFLADAASGSLPAVSYLDPRFQGEDQGISNDDHPHADIRVGETFLNEVYAAVTGGPGWPNTVLVITFDEWGGFFEHVAPHRAPDVLPAYRRRGFRIPVVLISPFAQRGRISHAVYDHTSILRMIEWRFGLAPLSVRDAHAHNLARELDTSHPNLDAPAYDVPVVTPTPCGPSVPGPGDPEWAPLAELAARVGFRVG